MTADTTSLPPAQRTVLRSMQEYVWTHHISGGWLTAREAAYLTEPTMTGTVAGRVLRALARLGHVRVRRGGRTTLYYSDVPFDALAPTPAAP